MPNEWEPVFWRGKEVKSPAAKNLSDHWLFQIMARLGSMLLPVALTVP